MAYDYSKARATAKRMIDKFGGVGFIRRAINSGTAFAPTQTTTDYFVTAVVTDYEKSEINGTLIGKTDRKALVAASSSDIVPTVADRFVWSDKAYEIVSINTVEPGGDAIIYELQVRF